MQTDRSVPERIQAPFVFGFGQVKVEVWPRCDHRLARFLIFKQARESGHLVLVGSGTEDETFACLARARVAAWRTGLAANGSAASAGRRPDV